MELQVRFARPVIASIHGQNHMVITVTPVNSLPARRPVASVIVLDTSSSMADHAERQTGSKLAYCQAALSHLVEHLPAGDCFSLVAFSDTARSEVPMTLIIDRSRPQVLRAIGALQADGFTNIEEGLGLGSDEFYSRLLQSHVGKLLLITDGTGNIWSTSLNNLTSQVHAWAAQGISTSTLGLGSNFGSLLLADLAAAGGGDFHHVSDLDQLLTILREEIEALACVSARNLELLIRIPPQIELRRNLNGHFERRIPGGVMVQLGDLTRAKSVAFAVNTPLEVDQINLEISARYLTPDHVQESQPLNISLPVGSPEAVQASPVNQSVTGMLFELITARGIAKAAQAFDDGEPNQSLTILTRTRQRLHDAARLYSLQQVDPAATQLVDKMEAKLLQRTFSASDSKEAYASSSKVRSSQTNQNSSVITLR